MAAVPLPPLVQIDTGPDVTKDRETYIGGSEAYKLLYEFHHGSGCARELADEKLGVEPDFPRDLTSRREIDARGFMLRGKYLEDLAAQVYAQQTGRSLARTSRLRRHPDHRGAAVHVDRLILKFDERGTGAAEIKTCGEGMFYNVLRKGLPAAWSIQLQWALWITGYSWGSFIVLGVFGGDEHTGLPLKYFDVERDVALHNIFADAVDNFWNALKANELPPQLPDPSDQRCKVCRYRLTCRGESIDPQEWRRLMADKDRKRPLQRVQDSELDEALADRALILSEMQALDHDSETDPGALQLVTQRIRELIGEEEAALEINDRWRLYSSEITWSGLDQQRLRRDQPELFSKYYIDHRPTGKKRLRVYAINNDGDER